MDKVSRSKIELFGECPRCFWLEVNKGIKRPPPAPYTINNAVDYLLKQEFDHHRENATPHPIMSGSGVEAVPFSHPEINKWRTNFTGVQYHHEPTNFLVFGAVDDVWINPKGELIVVDYKATGANQHQIYDSYQRQMEIYQWLLKQNNYPVSPTGYFVFAKVSKANGFGMGKASLPFDIFVEPCTGKTDWIEDALYDMRSVYDSEEGPTPGGSCTYCNYVKKASTA
ncbi:MAG: PD-(D/E)XK nuclease family protein [Anaplasmataceae bacterium]|nr:PD-(D/E)XK nuclease family protein [Anaplasmataceae bacterium]